MADKLYKKTLDEQMKGLAGEVERQTEEYKADKGTLGGKVMQYAYDTGLTGKVVKVGAATVIAYTLGFFVPIIGGVLGPATLIGYGGKKFIYDPLFKKKKK